MREGEGEIAPEHSAGEVSAGAARTVGIIGGEQPAHTRRLQPLSEKKSRFFLHVILGSPRALCEPRTPTAGVSPPLREVLRLLRWVEGRVDMVPRSCDADPHSTTFGTKVQGGGT